MSEIEISENPDCRKIFIVLDVSKTFSGNFSCCIFPIRLLYSTYRNALVRIFTTFNFVSIRKPILKAPS